MERQRWRQWWWHLTDLVAPGVAEGDGYHRRPDDAHGARSIGDGRPGHGLHAELHGQDHRGSELECHWWHVNWRASRERPRRRRGAGVWHLATGLSQPHALR